MKRKEDDQLRRFLRKAHRRWIAWRALERIGIYILIGCALAVPLIGVLWWRGQPAMPMVLAMLGLSALAGGVIGIVRRPSLLDTAMEADRQLELHDLLGTALGLPACRYLEDSWRANLAALAEAQCRELSPSQLVLRRLGSRAWGGIGLSAALVLTLGLMTTANTSAPARADSGSLARSVQIPDSTSHREGELNQQLGSLRNVRGDSRRSSPRDDGSRDLHGTGSASSVEDGGQPGISMPAASEDATGHGVSQTNAGAGQTRFDPAGSAPQRADQTETRAASGSAAGAPLSGSPIDPARGGTAPQSPSRAIPPWQSPSWSADRAAAIEKINRGNIPDAYRDLVREYFDPQPY